MNDTLTTVIAFTGAGTFVGAGVVFLRWMDRILGRLEAGA